MNKILIVPSFGLLVLLSIAPFITATTQSLQPIPQNYKFQSLLSNGLVGPPPLWNKTYGNTEFDEIYDMVPCTSGGYALTGHTYSWGAGNADAWLVRVDAEGNFLWNKTFGRANYDYGKAIVALSDGFAIAGYTSSFSASYDYWLIRTNLDGDELWNVTFGGTDGDYAYDLVASTGGGFTLVGHTYSFGAAVADTWLLHTDSMGNHVWNETYSGPYFDIGTGLVECSTGGYAICGYMNPQPAGDSDAWLIRTDAGGNHQWNQTFGNTGYDQTFSLIECSSGGFAIAGRTGSYDSSQAAWLIRTDAGGNHQWNQTYDEPDLETALAVIEYSEGGFVLAGYTSSPAPTNRKISDKNGVYNALLIRTDSSGAMLWNQTYGGVNADQYGALVECSNGDIITAGYTNSYGAGGSDGWLVKTPYPLVWNPVPTDQTTAYGASFSYDLNVTSWFTLDTWTINDTTNFAINIAGVISNAFVLASGVYGLQVTVNDTVGDEITGSFSVTVEAQITTPIPGFPIEAVALGAAIAIGFGVITRRRRKP